MLRQFAYARRRRAERGLLVRFLCKVTGYSRQQMTRLIAQFHAEHHLRDRRGPPAKPFARRYGLADQQALAELECRAWPALPTRHPQARRTRLPPLRRSLLPASGPDLGGSPVQPAPRCRLPTRSRRRTRQDPLRHQQHRRAAATAAQRPPGLHSHRQRPPRRSGRHQGGLPNRRRRFARPVPIQSPPSPASANTICCPRCSPASPSPCGFHADNGSEYINHRVAELLTKLNAEFTKSRPRHSIDNALAESKNGAVVRKHLGYTHIPSHFASQVSDFTLDVLSPYVNFHRPCFFAPPRSTPRAASADSIVTRI